MVLAKPVLDDKGRTLCSANTVLTSKILTRFDKMGISSIYIFTKESISDEEFNRLKEIINNRFSKISKGTLLSNLKDVLLERLEGKREGNEQPK